MFFCCSSWFFHIDKGCFPSMFQQTAFERIRRFPKKRNFSRTRIELRPKWKSRWLRRRSSNSTNAWRPSRSPRSKIWWGKSMNRFILSSSLANVKHLPVRPSPPLLSLANRSNAPFSSSGIIMRARTSSFTKSTSTNDRSEISNEQYDFQTSSFVSDNVYLEARLIMIDCCSIAQHAASTHRDSSNLAVVWCPHLFQPQFHDLRTAEQNCLKAKLSIQTIIDHYPVVFSIGQSKTIHCRGFLVRNGCFRIVILLLLMMRTPCTHQFVCFLLRLVCVDWLVVSSSEQ